AKPVDATDLKSVSRQGVRVQVPPSAPALSFAKPVTPSALPSLPPVFDYAGVTVFALTGALAAARDRHDFITFVFFAVVTGVGGGTLRDLLIGAPVFWIGDPTYLAIGAIAALAVWLIAGRLERATALIWLDALGLAAYAVIGAGKALALGVNPPVS